MSENTPTPAAATPAVLTQQELAYLRGNLDEWHVTEFDPAVLGRLLATLNAATARADAEGKEWRIQANLRELAMSACLKAQAALAQERQAREQAEHRAQSAHMAAAAEYERYRETEAALAAERARGERLDTRERHLVMAAHYLLDCVGEDVDSCGEAFEQLFVALGQYGDISALLAAPSSPAAEPASADPTTAATAAQAQRE